MSRELDRKYGWKETARSPGKDPLSRQVEGNTGGYLSPSSELDLLILGPVPPPLGGISVHVSRLVPLLLNAGLEVGVLNHFSSTEMSFVIGALKRNPLNYYRLPKRIPARVVHYHHSHWSMLMAVALGKGRRRSRYVLTAHGTDLPRRLNSRVPLLRSATRWALRRFDAIIVVNPHIRVAIQDHVGERPIEVLPAFIEAQAEESPYEASIETFLSGGPILLVPAFRVQFLPDGRDMYGLDTVGAAFAVIARERPELRLVFFIAERPRGRKAAKHLQRVVRQMEDAGVRDRVLIAFGLPLTPAFRHNAVVVRATRIEGDALSVREALHAEVPVVASDVVDRPPGTVTFSTDDVADLCRALRHVLDTPRARQEQFDSAPTSEGADSQFLAPLIRIYRGHMEPRPWRGTT
jgi:glycosyltransferase involved in cell wall biosynthesis